MVNEILNTDNFVGYFKLESDGFFMENKGNVSLMELPLDYAFYSNDFLTTDEVEFFNCMIKEKIELPVGITGYMDEYNKGDKIGSYRGSIFDKKIANNLFHRLKGIYPENRDFSKSLNSDHDNHAKWKFVGINPLFRFIKYKKGGKLVPHYDAPYISSSEERTLVTMVIYLTTNHSGHTRFIKDPQERIPVIERDLEDWKREALPEEIMFKIKPEKGKLVLFDHRLVHDSEPLVNDSDKIIIRTDLVFKKV